MHASSLRRRDLAAALAAVLVAVCVASAPALAAGETAVVVEPAESSVAPGETTTVDVVVQTTQGGVGAYNVTLSTDSSVATVTDATLHGEPRLRNVTYGTGNSSVTAVAAIADTADAGSVAVLTVTLTGESTGETALDLRVAALGDENGNAYDVQRVRDGTLTVGSGGGGDTTTTDDGSGGGGGPPGGGQPPATSTTGETTTAGNGAGTATTDAPATSATSTTDGGADGTATTDGGAATTNTGTDGGDAGTTDGAGSPDTTSTGPTTESGGMPGFGIPAALTALTALAVLATRPRTGG